MSTQRFEQLIRSRNNDLIIMQVDIITASQRGKKKKKHKTKDEISKLLSKLSKEQVLSLLGGKDE